MSARLLFLALTLLVTPGVHAAGTMQTARPWIGILIGPGTKGVLIKEVLPSTPAEKAGLKARDEVLSIDGSVVKAEGELIGRVQERGVGQRVTLKVLRSGKDLTIALALEARPDELKMLRDQLLGKPAPPFELAGASAASLKGQVVVLEFWATWCGPCRASLPRLGEWQKKYGPRGLRVIGISDEDPALVSKFAASKKVLHTVGSDEKAKAAYRVPAVPMLVVIDRTGVVKHVEIGAGQKLDLVEQAFLPLLAR
jgi:thiol-disulfide isomerase/thioredoxin